MYHVATLVLEGPIAIIVQDCAFVVVVIILENVRKASAAKMHGLGVFGAICFRKIFGSENLTPRTSRDRKLFCLERTKAKRLHIGKLRQHII